MDGETLMINLLKSLFRWLVGVVSGSRSHNLVRPSDKGLFDPFSPISSLKKIDNDYQANYGVSNVDNDFEKIMSETSTQEGSFTDNVEPTPAFLFFRVVVVLVALGLGVRLIGLQITQGQENFSLAEG